MALTRGLKTMAGVIPKRSLLMEVCPKQKPKMTTKEVLKNSPNCIHEKWKSISNVRHYSSIDQNFLAKFSEEIDLDGIREQRIKQLRDKGVNFHTMDVVRSILTEKCDEALANLSEEDQKKFKVIKLEHDFLFSEGYAIPTQDEMSSENWLTALSCSSMRGRLRYYISEGKKKLMAESAKAKKKAQQELAAQQALISTDVDIEESNRLFLRLYPSAIRRWQNYRMTAAMRFGIPLVLDMDYATLMSNQDLKNTSKQLVDVYSLNRADEELPFHLHFTGCPNTNPIYRHFQMKMQDSLHMMATVTPQSYLDLFDRDRLVYLSPNGRKVLREFDPNAVYIIGAYNDKSHHRPESYARAMEQSIQCQRLPLDEYLDWQIGGKALTLDQMMKIMTAIKNKKSWPEAFEAVPSRKYTKPDAFEEVPRRKYTKPDAVEGVPFRKYQSPINKWN